MKVKVSYTELSSVLGYVNTILSDKTVEDKMKNIIFLVSKDDAIVSGFSSLTFSKTRLSDVTTEGIEEGENWDFQVKASDLNKIIGCYNSLYKTKVENVEFSLEKNKIKVAVHEEAVSEEDINLSQTSKFLLDNIPILDTVSREIHIDFPEESDSILSSDLLLYIESLFPLMNNDTSGGLTSKLHFSEDYIFVMASYINSFFKNKLPDAFKGVTLGYSSVNFLKKLAEGSESIDVQKTDRHICIQSGMTEAYLRYQGVKPKIEQYFKRMSKDNGIVLDRLYLKDVLKRLQFSSQDGVVKMVEDMGLEVSNEGFSQIIPLSNKKGSVDNIKFKVSTPIFAKSILGDDGVFPEEVYIYFVKAGSGYILYIMDSSDSWFSTIQVRI